MKTPELKWLPVIENWNQALKDIPDQPGSETWSELVKLAGSRLDFISTVKIDRQLIKLFGDAPPENFQFKPIRLAVLGSSTVDHLFPGIRIGALRRGLWTTIYKSDYGQYMQELRDKASELRAWKPNTILFSFDARHLFGGFSIKETATDVDAHIDRVIGTIVSSWRIARDELGCQIIQQTALPVFPRLLGNNEHRLSSSPAALVDRFNHRIRQVADQEGVALLAIDQRVAVDGLSAWYDPLYWHKAKQEIHSAASPMYGDLVGRSLAAMQGRSCKCLVLDLDNTLWGGVIGDDGLDGIVLGQGGALGEAYVSFQHFVRDLSHRGIVLAVCSKNDHANAIEPFEKHSEMVLKSADIACFSASWQDKAEAIRNIAKQLNLGLDALVFVDDNPFERAIVRKELPMVAVPELPADPALYADTIAEAGYFETLYLTSDDFQRANQYQANILRESLKDSASDVEGYLKSLNMEMQWSRFKKIDQQRVVQLINKTNQFNLTTRRYSDEEVSAVIADPKVLSLQIRLTDQFGDNGIISLIIGRFIGESADIEIDTWLMSCRVLGRQVEQATLNLIAAEAKRLGAARIIGHYRPTAKNGMVKDLYPKLGFSKLSSEGDDVYWSLDIADYQAIPTFIKSIEN